MITIKKLSIFVNKKPLLLNVSFCFSLKSFVGLFGESGSGKSVFSLFLLGLLNPSVFVVSAKSATFKIGDYCFDFLTNSSSDWNFFRSNYISMIFQDPSASLNPTLTCGEQLKEVFVKRGVDDDVFLNCLNLFSEVELKNPKKIFNSFPHQISGGQKQRVVIAIALASNPSFLIADEPTTALDPSTQKEILDLVLRLKLSRSIFVLFISHNFDLLNHFCDKIVVFKNHCFYNYDSIKVSHYIKKRRLLLNNIKNRVFSDLFKNKNKQPSLPFLNFSLHRWILFKPPPLSPNHTLRYSFKILHVTYPNNVLSCEQN